jgi:hypothetical protein
MIERKIYILIFSTPFFRNISHSNNNWAKYDKKKSVLLAQYFSNDRKMRCAGHIARMRERRGAYRLLVGKPERKRQIGRTRRRWEDNIKMDLQEVGCGGMNWIYVARDRDRWRALMSAVMNIRIP